MKRFIPFLLLTLVSCKREFPPVPDDVIPVHQMEAMLTDMHITDAIAETKGQEGQSEQLLTRNYHEQLFKNYNVTAEKFYRSFKFYESSPKLYNKMYDEILVEMSKREENVDKK